MVKKGSLYSASDKAFYDALCQQKMSKPALQELLWRRGIILANKSEKEDVAKYFSRLEHDYFDHKFISEKVSTGSNREKQTSSFVNLPLPLNDIEQIAKALVDERKEIDNSIDFTSTKQSVNIDLSYSYYDHNRPEFKQLVTRNARVSIEISREGINIRAPANEYVAELTSELLAKIDEKSTSDIEVETISLYGVDDPEVRIKFFEQLISGLENMTVYNVSDVAVYNPDTGEDESGVHVKKASLNGDGILRSGELQQFYKKGFFVYRISWSAKYKSDPKSDIYNFQAQFNDPESCRKFSYLSKGFYKRMDNGEFTKNQSHLPANLELTMLRMLEESARRSRNDIFSSKGKGSEDEVT